MKKKAIIFLVVVLIIFVPNKMIKSNSIDILFKIPLNEIVLHDPVIDDNGNIYLLTDEGTFYAFRNDGTKIFNLSIRKMKQKPCAYSDLILSNDGIIYFTITNIEKAKNSNEDDTFKSYCYSIDVINQKIKNYWELTYDDPKVFPPKDILEQIYERLPKASAMDKDDTVYFGSYDSKIFTFSANNNVKAAYRINSIGKICTIAISCLKNNQSLIYIEDGKYSSTGYYLHSRSLEGALLFTSEPISSPDPFYDRISDIVIDENGLIYFICSSTLPKSNQGYAYIDSNLYVFDPSTPLIEIGNDSFLPMKPKFKIPIKGFAEVNSLIIGNNNEVFISGDDAIYSFDLRGKIHQIYKCKNVFIPILDKDNNLYLGVDIDNDYEADLLTCISSKGTLLWNYPIKLKAGPVITNNNNIICTDSNFLYSLRTNCPGLSNSAWPTYMHDNKHTNRIDIIDKKETILTTTIKLKIGSKVAYIDDKRKTLDAAPYISNSRTMVPFRFIAEAIDADVSYNIDPISKTVSQVIYTKKNIKITLTIGSNYAIVNNKKIKIDAAPEIIKGRTFVPVRFVTEQLGGKVYWQQKTQEITIVFQQKF